MHCVQINHGAYLRLLATLALALALACGGVRARISETSHVRVDTGHKLGYCLIAKNACSKFKTLLDATRRDVRAIEQPHGIHGGKLENAIHFERVFPHGGSRKYRELLQSPASNWTFFVVVRDPLERLLSGFEDKCVHKVHWPCLGLPSKHRKRRFVQFARRMIAVLNNPHKNSCHMDGHFMPQHCFCGLRELLPDYDFVLKYSFDGIGAETEQMLHAVGLNRYFHGWGANHNETMFGGHTTHTNGATSRGDASRLAFYDRHLTRALAEELVEAFAEDYAVLRLQPPQWIQKLSR